MSSSITMYARAVGVRAEVVDLDDAGMIDRRRRARLVEEPLHDRRVARQLRQQHLERRRPPELDVLGAIHHAHAALPELGDDPVVTDDLSEQLA